MDGTIDIIKHSESVMTDNSELIDLTQRREQNEWSIKTHGHVLPLKASLPFIKSNRGVLTHRVKYGQYHKIQHRMSHASITCYCEMTLFPDRCEATGKPWPDEIVCRRCEQAALLDDKPSSSELVGRHVHVGGVKAFADCCDVTREQPNDR